VQVESRLSTVAPGEAPAEGTQRDSIPVLDVVLDPAAPPSSPLAPGRRRRLSPTQLAVGGALLGLVAMLAILAVVIGADADRRQRIWRAIVNPRGAAAATAELSPPAVTLPGAASAVAPAEPPPPPTPKVFRVRDLASLADVKLITGAIDRRTFIDALTDSGILKAQTYRLLAAFKGVHDLERPRRRDSFVAAIETASHRVRAFEYEVGPTEIYQARERDDHSLAAERVDLHIERKRALAAIVLGDDMTKSIEGAGLDRSLVDWLDDAFEGRAELPRMRPGSRLRVVAEYETASGAFARYVDLPAVEYVPHESEAASVRVYHFHEEKTQGYFDANGRQPYKGAFRTPVLLSRITSRFNMHRMHPILHVVMPHNGVDFAASVGTPVYAASAGTVEWIGDSGPSGNLVTLRHTGGITTGYAHLSRFAPRLSQGQPVDARQLIGYVGSTGRSTGPHLHFSARKDGVFIDPLRLKLDGERVLPKSDRPEFDKERVPLDQLLDAIALPESADGKGAAPHAEGEDLEPLDEVEGDR
jgi:murein DD-endopeptidase MepM/ murein hydrolase activator NlpD